MNGMVRDMNGINETIIGLTLGLKRDINEFNRDSIGVSPSTNRDLCGYLAI